MANSLLADRDASPVGKRWAHNFVKRQPELKTRLFRKYDYQRAKCEDPTIIRNWFRLVANTVAKYGIRSDDMWNFDETGFMMGIIQSGMVVTGSEREGRPKSVQPGNREWITAIQAINAEGQLIPPFLIGTGQYHLANWYRECDLPGDWVIATSRNGWTNNELGLEWLKHFDRSTSNRSVGVYRLLILDGHESHHSANFERYCEENKIITLCMPAHASHLLQPLDVGCFAVLKQAYGRQIEHLIRCSITHISKTEFFDAFYAAFKATFTKSNIRGGFKGAGLAPFNPENVISKLDVQLRTPTPPGEATEPSTPWTSKTPTTAIEAQSHVFTPLQEQDISNFLSPPSPPLQPITEDAFSGHHEPLRLTSIISSSGVPEAYSMERSLPLLPADPQLPGNIDEQSIPHTGTSTFAEGPVAVSNHQGPDTIQDIVSAITPETSQQVGNGEPDTVGHLARELAEQLLNFQGCCNECHQAAKRSHMEDTNEHISLAAYLHFTPELGPDILSRETIAHQKDDLAGTLSPESRRQLFCGIDSREEVPYICLDHRGK
ncbi:hypothetical protein FPOA_14053 [Fusarium poae]|uniref:DDE-1 domain-containing protein n=1 Tax=Fusarium poae TaxID=36050 RepID=A0A1B8A3I3_FUSPO|nr:hypothetical protein FPOA_14053 [Fusarium poae]